MLLAGEPNRTSDRASTKVDRDTPASRCSHRTANPAHALRQPPPRLALVTAEPTTREPRLQAPNRFGARADRDAKALQAWVGKTFRGRKGGASEPRAAGR